MYFIDRDRIGIAGCGHAIVKPSEVGAGLGFVAFVDGRTTCFPCANDAHRAELDTAMESSGYVDERRWVFTTFTGGYLGRITHLRTAKRTTPTGGQYQIRYITVRDVHGREWYGRGNNDHDLVTIRRKDILRSPVQRCAWFAMCTNPATLVVDHPVLGAVPSCQRCQDVTR